MNKKQLTKAKYLSDFENEVIKHKPQLSGKINWDSAIFFYNSGVEYKDACARYLLNN